MNSQASYPYQLCEAAREFSNSCTAYAHLHKSHDSSGLRIQAPEIMMQFVGDVDFGRGTPSHFLDLPQADVESH